jgi:hypothetical protein
MRTRFHLRRRRPPRPLAVNVVQADRLDVSLAIAEHRPVGLPEYLRIRRSGPRMSVRSDFPFE